MKTRALLLSALLAGCGTDVSGPSPSLFSCVLSAATILETGEVLQVRGAGNQGVCLAGDGEVAEFVYIPFFASNPPASDERTQLTVGLTGAGFQPVAGPPTPARMGPDPASLRTVRLGPAAADRGTPGSELRQDLAFHDRLRRQEVEELGRRIRSGGLPRRSVHPDAAAAGALPAVVPETGELLDLNVSISCSREDIRTGRVEYVSDHAIVVADTANPEGLSSADYAHFGVTFDTLVHPVAVAHFGSPTDIDENERSLIFFTRAVNELTPPGSDVFTAGFFWSGDLFPETDTPRAQACPASNHAEMFYLLTADPEGEIGVKFETDFIRESGVATIAHEYQHLINASRRLWVNQATTFEAPWLNEGLSHAAEELVFYAASGLEPRSNLTIEALRDAENGVPAFNAYMGRNFSNFASYLAEPDTASLMGIDVLTTRGASWAFLRYAADRSGSSDAAFFGELVNARNAGLDNLRSVTGGSPLAWMQDWTVAVYADDAVPSMAPQYTMPSWNFRDLYPASSVEEFPLSVIGLESGTSRSVGLWAGGAVFARFAIDADGRATVHVESRGGEPPPTLRGSFLRTR